MQCYHIARGVKAEKMGMFEIKCEPFRYIRDAIVGTSVVQNGTFRDGGRHDTVA